MGLSVCRAGEREGYRGEAEDLSGDEESVGLVRRRQASKGSSVYG